MKKTASITPAMSNGSQLTTNAWQLHTEFVIKVTEGSMIRKEFLFTVAFVLKQAGKIRTGKRKKPTDQPQGVGCWLPHDCTQSVWSVTFQPPEKLEKNYVQPIFLRMWIIGTDAQFTCLG